jgi:hypothetical protein
MRSKSINAIGEMVHHTLMRYDLAMLPTLSCHGPAAMQGLGTMRGTKVDKCRVYLLKADPGLRERDVALRRRRETRGDKEQISWHMLEYCQFPQRPPGRVWSYSTGSIAVYRRTFGRARTNATMEPLQYGQVVFHGQAVATRRVGNVYRFSSDQGLRLLETSNDARDIQPDAQTVEPLPFAGEGPQL